MSEHVDWPQCWESCARQCMSYNIFSPIEIALDLLLRGTLDFVPPWRQTSVVSRLTFYGSVYYQEWRIH